MRADSSRPMTSPVESVENADSMASWSARRFFTRSGFVLNRSSTASSGRRRTSAQNLAHSRACWMPSVTWPPSPARNGPYGAIDAWLGPLGESGAPPYPV